MNLLNIATPLTSLKGAGCGESVIHCLMRERETFYGILLTGFSFCPLYVFHIKFGRISTYLVAMMCRFINVCVCK